MNILCQQDCFGKYGFGGVYDKAMKKRKIKEAKDAKKPQMTNDEYWEKVHNDRNNNV